MAYNSRFHFTPHAPFDCTTCRWYREPCDTDPDDKKNTCYQGIFMPRWAKLYSQDKPCDCSKYLVKRKNFDNDIYDAPEGKDYIKGYALTVYITLEQKKILVLGKVVREGLCNVYAYIPTDYVSQGVVPYAVAYLIFASKFEQKIARYALTGQSSKMQNASEIRNVRLKSIAKPVWFHKGWVLPTYDPELVNTDAKKYKYIANHNGCRKLFTNKQIAKWRRAYCMTFHCYAPKSEQDKDCVNYVRGLKNNKICRYCAASKHGKVFADTLGLHRIDD